MKLIFTILKLNCPLAQSFWVNTRNVLKLPSLIPIFSFQRSYDWNYNLNRHLKYECGKENAFMCSKCGRKFPHKQNCVYHLKRKHKIICDSVDQYVQNGLVVFTGSAQPGASLSPPPGGLSSYSPKEGSVTPPPSNGWTSLLLVSNTEMEDVKRELGSETPINSFL